LARRAGLARPHSHRGRSGKCAPAALQALHIWRRPLTGSPQTGHTWRTYPWLQA